MFSKLGLIGGMFAAVTTLSLANVVEADTTIDAWTFVNDADFCGDERHTIPAGEVLTIDGGAGTQSSGRCKVWLEEGSTLEIVGGAVLDIRTFELFDESGPVAGVPSNNVTVSIEDSKIFSFGGGTIVEFYRGVNNKIICEDSFIGGIDDLDFWVGSDGTVELDECKVTNVDGSFNVRAAVSSGQTGGEIEIDESIFTVTNGTKIRAGSPDSLDGDIEIEDSIFMEAWRVWIQTSGKLRVEDNVFGAVSSGLVVIADDCKSEDDFVVGTGPTDICP